MTDNEKLCSKCGTIKPITEFGKKSKNKDGLDGWCRSCNRQQAKAWYNANTKRAAATKKEARIVRGDILRQRVRDWRSANKDHLRAYWRKYHEQNYSRKQVYKTVYRKRNRELLTAYQKKWRNNPAVRMRINISNRLRDILKTGKAGTYWETLVGWSANELWPHLETLLQPGMTRNNYGLSSGATKWWTIDHKKSIHSFGYPMPGTQEFKDCWSLENLQPMWSSENFSKQHYPCPRSRREISYCVENTC